MVRRVGAAVPAGRVRARPAAARSAARACSWARRLSSSRRLGRSGCAAGAASAGAGAASLTGADVELAPVIELDLGLGGRQDPGGRLGGGRTGLRDGARPRAVAMSGAGGAAATAEARRRARRGGVGTAGAQRGQDRTLTSLALRTLTLGDAALGRFAQVLHVFPPCAGWRLGHVGFLFLKAYGVS